jgi:hypothetical protein
MNAMPAFVPLLPASPPDRRLVGALRRILVIGACLVLAVPAARGHSQWLGALPLWLVAMPMASLWALQGCPLPRRRTAAEATAQAGSGRRRRGPQARRRRQYPAASRAFSASARPMSISSAARQNS